MTRNLYSPATAYGVLNVDLGLGPRRAIAVDLSQGPHWAPTPLEPCVLESLHSAVMHDPQLRDMQRSASANIRRMDGIARPRDGQALLRLVHVDTQLTQHPELV